MPQTAATPAPDDSISDTLLMTHAGYFLTHPEVPLTYEGEPVGQWTRRHIARLSRELLFVRQWTRVLMKNACRTDAMARENAALACERLRAGMGPAIPRAANDTERRT